MAADEPKAPAKPVKILGICCSPRAGKSTAVALKACLDAAAETPNVQVELIELAGMKINGSVAAGVELEAGERDDFPALAPKLSAPEVGGVIFGTPVYFGNMTSLCKAFLERCMVLRKNNFAWANKVAGVLAVGGARNGGQELTIRSVQTALMAQRMIVVGDGNPSGHIGATLWNDKAVDDVTKDEFGMTTAKNLGRHVAEVAVRCRGC
jgi:multimeric flavodoxin WrbA